MCFGNGNVFTERRKSNGIIDYTVTATYSKLCFFGCKTMLIHTTLLEQGNGSNSTCCKPEKERLPPKHNLILT